MCRCINLIAISAVVFVTTFAVGNLDHLSFATKIYASLFNSSGSGPAKSNYTSSLGSTTGPIWNECFFLCWVLNFYLAQCSVCNFVPSAQLPDVFGETRHGY